MNTPHPVVTTVGDALVREMGRSTWAVERVRKARRHLRLQMTYIYIYIWIRKLSPVYVKRSSTIHGLAAIWSFVPRVGSHVPGEAQWFPHLSSCEKIETRRHEGDDLLGKGK